MRISDFSIAAVLSLGAAGALAQSGAAKDTPRRNQRPDSVVLVEDLLKADNALAREALRKSGLLPISPDALSQGKEPKGKVLAPPAVIRVASIYGIGGKLRASVAVNGIPAVAEPGVVLGECRVEAIRDRCVVMRPIGDKTALQRCAAACWSGDSAPLAFAGPPGTVLPPLPPGLAPR